MPFYYAINPGGQTTNATANTASDHIAWRTGSQGRALAAIALRLAPAFATVGAMALHLQRRSNTAIAGGTAFTPAKRHPGNPTETTTYKTGLSVGGSSGLRIGGAQSGGPGEWVATEYANAFWYPPDTGTSDSFGGVRSIATSASVLFDFTAEVAEVW